MKKLIFLMFLFFVVVSAKSQLRTNLAIGGQINTSSAFLDASSTSTWNSSTNIGKGLIFPRVNLTTFATVSPTTGGLPTNYPTRFDGMLVYNSTTGTAAIGGTSVTPGFYYYYNTSTTDNNAGSWIRLASSSDIGTKTGAVFPGAPNEGDVFYRTDLDNLYYYNGTSWVAVSTIPNGTDQTTVSNPVIGNIYFNTADGKVYYYDGDSWESLSGLSSTLANGSFFVGNSSNVATATAKNMIPLSGFAAATADIALGGFKITGLATPTVGSDAATMAYVDSKTATTPNGTAFPSSPSEGDVFYRTDLDNLYYYNGTSWVAVSTIPSGTDQTSVSNPVIGNTYFNTTDGKVYYYDGDSWESLSGLSSTLANGSFFVGNGSNIATATAKNMIPLSGFATATADIALGGFKITGLATPTVGSDAATMAYVDSKTATTPNGTAFPSSPSEGDVFYRTDLDNLYYYNGTSWVAVSTIPSGTDQTSVSNPVIGNTYFNTTDGKVYYYDGDSWESLSGLSSTLANGSFFVGNGSNIATATAKNMIPLSGFAAATADVALGGFKITGLATPTVGSDAATMAYVDSKTATTPNGTSFPLSPSEGDVFYRTDLDNLYYYNGIGWVAVSTIPSGANQASVSNPVIGNTYFNTTDGKVYYYDGDSWESLSGLSSTLANGSFFVGNGSNIATATAKNMIPLSGFAAATADVALGGFKITGLATPTDDTDAATKKYVDLAVGSKKWTTVSSGTYTLLDDDFYIVCSYGSGPVTITLPTPSVAIQGREIRVFELTGLQIVQFTPAPVGQVVTVDPGTGKIFVCTGSQWVCFGGY